MKKIKKELDPDLNQLWQMEAIVEKVFELFAEDQLSFSTYVKKRDQLLVELKVKDQEITKLQNDMLRLSNRQSNRLFHAYERLHLQHRKIVNLQQEYFMTKRSVEDLRQKASHLKQEKEKVFSERNWLKIEYDYAKGTLEENEQSIVRLKERLLALKRQEASEKDPTEWHKSIVELDRKKARLLNDRSLLQHKVNELRPLLLKKMKDLTQMTNQIEALKQHIIEKKEKIEQLEEAMHKHSEHIVKHKQQYATMIKQYEQSQKEISAKEELLNQGKNNIAVLKRLLIEAGREYHKRVEAKDLAIHDLKKQLLNIQKEFILEENVE